MNEARRARSASASEWDRARRAYAALIADHDPARSARARPAMIDLRPQPASGGAMSSSIVSGPHDLREVREAVEAAIGIGCWPNGTAVAGEVLTTTLRLERPALVMSLLLSMDGLIERRSPWGQWRSVVDSLHRRIAEIEVLTIEAVIIE